MLANEVLQYGQNMGFKSDDDVVEIAGTERNGQQNRHQIFQAFEEYVVAQDALGAGQMEPTEPRDDRHKVSGAM